MPRHILLKHCLIEILFDVISAGHFEFKATIS